MKLLTIIFTCLLSILFNVRGNVVFQEDTLNFGIISDIQYSDRDQAGTRFYRGVPAKLRQAIDTINNNKIDFLLNLGDIIDKN